MLFTYFRSGSFLLDNINCSESEGGDASERKEPRRSFSSDDIFPNAPRMTHYMEEANV